MVISPENHPRPPDPLAAVAAPTRGESQSHLHNFSFPILKKWGNQRVLRCLNVNRKGEIIAGDRRSAAAGRSDRIGAPKPVDEGERDDSGLEEVRAKLLVHLREAADRIKLVPVPEPAPVPAPAPEPTSSLAAEESAKPWSLRTRRGGGPRSPMEIERNLSTSPPPAVEKRTVRLRSEDVDKRERPKFSISLSRDEVDEDFYALTGSRARRRPKKRPRAVQRQLDMLFPGSWLTEITADSYKVPD